jgi:hypothetical protein
MVEVDRGWPRWCGGVVVLSFDVDVVVVVTIEDLGR